MHTAKEVRESHSQDKFLREMMQTSDVTVQINDCSHIHWSADRICRNNLLRFIRSHNMFVFLNSEENVVHVWQKIKNRAAFSLWLCKNSKGFQNMYKTKSIYSTQESMWSMSRLRIYYTETEYAYSNRNQLFHLMLTEIQGTVCSSS